MSWLAWTRDQRLSLVTLTLCLGTIPLLAFLWWLTARMPVDQLREIALGVIGLILVIEVAQAMVLSIRAFKGSIGREGATLDIDGTGGSAGDKLQDAGVALVDAGAAVKGEAP